MIDNIKTLFARLINKNKSLVFQALADEFKLNIVYVKQEYIWKGKIPEHRQARVLEVVQNTLKQQEAKTAEILG